MKLFWFVVYPVWEENMMIQYLIWRKDQVFKHETKPQNHQFDSTMLNPEKGAKYFLFFSISFPDELTKEGCSTQSQRCEQNKRRRRRILKAEKIKDRE